MSNKLTLLITLLAFALWRIWALNFMPFFWDAPLGLMEPALYFYKHGLHNFIIPPTILAEPPLAPWLLALLWKITGVSLWSSHLFISIFVLGSVYHTVKIVEKIIPKQKQIWVLILIFIESAWLAHSQHISPDLILIFLGLWAIRCMQNNQFIQLIVPLIFLSLLSVRGEITVIGLGLGWLIHQLILDKKQISQFKWWVAHVSPFIPAMITSIIYWISRKLELGYFYFDPNYISLNDRSIVTIFGFIKNVLVLGLRFIDMGRIFYWIALGIALWIYRKNILSWIKEQSFWIGTFSGLLLAILPFTLPFSNPFSARYFILHFMLMSIILGTILVKSFSKKWLIICVSIISVGSISSHFVFPPIDRARVWDCNLATLIYFKQVEQAEAYFENHGIPLSEVGFDHTEKYLRPDPWRDRIHSDQYALISHVQNPSDHTLDSLDTYWQEIADFTRYGLYMKAFKKVAH